MKFLPAVKDRCEPFQNIILNVKCKGFFKFQKNFAREETVNINIFTR